MRKLRLKEYSYKSKEFQNPHRSLATTFVDRFSSWTNILLASHVTGILEVVDCPRCRRTGTIFFRRVARFPDKNSNYAVIYRMTCIKCDYGVLLRQAHLDSIVHQYKIYLFEEELLMHAKYFIRSRLESKTLDELHYPEYFITCPNCLVPREFHVSVEINQPLKQQHSVYGTVTFICKNCDSTYNKKANTE